MEVTAKNYAEALPLIKAALQEADFVAFDTELTGVDLGGENRIHVFDTADERYAKLRRNTERFLAIQLGLCAFRWSEETQRHEVQAFSVLVFPAGESQLLTAQASSLRFLVGHGFDLTRLVRDGLPYMRRDYEVRTRARAADKVAAAAPAAGLSPPSRPVIAVPPGRDAALVADAEIRVREWLAAGATEPLRLPKCSSFARRLLYQELGRVFGDTIALATVRGQEQLEVTRPVVDPAARAAAAAAAAESELQAAIGARAVVDVLLQTGRPLVGHNLLLDLLHLHGQFVGPLPATLAEWTAQLHELLPLVLDTKHVATHAELAGRVREAVQGGGTALGDLHQLSLLSEGAPAVAGLQGAAHEAAFDAWMTGCVLIRLAHQLGQHGPLHAAAVLAGPLAPLANRLHLMRSDLPFLPLAGPPPPPPARSASLHVSGFPVAARTEHLQALFADWAPVRISWIDDRSVFLTLDSPSRVPSVLERFRCAPAAMPELKVCTFAEFKAQNAEGDNRPSKRSRGVDEVEAAKRPRGPEPPRSSWCSVM